MAKWLWTAVWLYQLYHGGVSLDWIGFGIFVIMANMQVKEPDPRWSMTLAEIWDSGFVRWWRGSKTKLPE